MAKIANVTFTLNGEKYAFKVYNSDVSFNDVSCVYIFTKRTVKNGRGNHELLYIGETGELGTRIANHEKWDCVDRHGCNCICAQRVDGKNARLDIESAFLDAYETPCNDIAFA